MSDLLTSDVSLGDFQIVKAHPHLIIYVDSLQKKNAEALSFYPKCVFERESEKGRIFLGLLNGEPCGYIYVGALGIDVKCHQVCIQYDLRRRLYGAALVQAMEDYAKDASSITLRCGFDLDANTFWKGLGYECIRVQDGGVRRMRKINVWRKAFWSTLFLDETIESAVGKVDASLWRRNKKKGIVTGFTRGKAMLDYRKKLISEDSKIMTTKPLKLSGNMRVIQLDANRESIVSPENLGIKTVYCHPPIPPRQFDWSAYRDGQEEDGPIGYGSTKQEAIDDLLELEDA